MYVNSIASDITAVVLNNYYEAKVLHSVIGSCNSSEFICGKPRSCVPQSAQCNGEADCSDSSDESSCCK